MAVWVFILGRKDNSTSAFRFGIPSFFGSWRLEVGSWILGSKPLIGKNLKNFEVFLENYASKIVEKWVNYFVYHKEVEYEKITKKLK